MLKFSAYYAKSGLPPKSSLGWRDDWRKGRRRRRGAGKRLRGVGDDGVRVGKG